MAGLAVSVSAQIRFACQTYSWQMSGERYRGRLDNIGRAVADAGFHGLEPEVFMLGSEFRAERRLASLLSDCGLELAALAYAAAWSGGRESKDERVAADEAIALLQAFPGAKLVLVQLPGADRENLVERQRRALACMNAVAGRALSAGIEPTVHPNSPPGSVFRTADDYEVLLAGLDPGIGFTPDVGHIAAGGMDALDLVRRYRGRIDHVHFKDIHGDGSWAATGAGQLDFAALLSFLAETGYEGWVVFEDESENARSDPAAAARRNGAFARAVLQPLLGARARDG